MSASINYFWLRCVGFRFHSNNCSNVPHMVYVLDNRMDTALEIAPSIVDGWTVWLRSDMAHSRCRFCYLRTVKTCEQLSKLVEAIMDVPLGWELRDEKEFEKSLVMQTAEAERHYAEYVKNERWSYIPG